MNIVLSNILQISNTKGLVQNLAFIKIYYQVKI